MEHLSVTTGNAKAQVLADTLDKATGEFLDCNKSPSRKVGELDNRGSHFYLAMYWAKALAEQTSDGELKACFTGVAQAFTKQEDKIVAELNDAQGPAMDIGGYYFADAAKADKAMRSSETLNTILSALL